MAYFIRKFHRIETQNNDKPSSTTLHCFVSNFFLELLRPLFSSINLLRPRDLTLKSRHPHTFDKFSNNFTFLECELAENRIDYFDFRMYTNVLDLICRFSTYVVCIFFLNSFQLIKCFDTKLN